MSNWDYVMIAYTAAWGALAVYALALARRVTQARRVADALRDGERRPQQDGRSDSAICDTQPAP